MNPDKLQSAELGAPPVLPKDPFSDTSTFNERIIVSTPHTVVGPSMMPQSAPRPALPPRNLNTNAYWNTRPALTGQVPVAPSADMSQSTRIQPEQTFISNTNQVLRNIGHSSKSGDKLGILVMGASGVGKSSFIAAGVGKPLEVGHKTEPRTKVTQGWDHQFSDGSTITLVDTLGFNDVRWSDMDVLTSITEYIQQNQLRIMAVVYLHSISQIRVTGSMKTNLRMLRAVCGEHFFQNIFLISSMWNTIADSSMADTVAREVEFNTSTAFWADVIEKGATYARWDETEQLQGAMSAAGIINLCRNKHNPPLLNVILELNKGRVLEGTSAGQILAEQLKKRQEQERQELLQEQEELATLERQRMMLQERMSQVQEEIRQTAENQIAQSSIERNFRRPMHRQSSSHHHRPMDSPPPSYRLESSQAHSVPVIIERRRSENEERSRRRSRSSSWGCF